MKNILRNWVKKAKKGFVYLLIFITLETSVYVGLNSISESMQNTIKNYYDKTNLMDIKISSLSGFNKSDDIDFKALDGVKDIMMVKTINCNTKINNDDYTIKVSSINEDENSINKPILTHGKYPKTINEGLVEESFLNDNNLSIGSLITLEPQDKNYLKAKKIKITGTVNTSYYISKNKQDSSYEDNIDYYMYLQADDFNVSYFNEIYITLKDSYKYDTYSLKYDKYVNDKKQAIFDVATKKSEETYNIITQDLKDEISILEANLNDMYNLNVPQESISESIKIATEQLSYAKEKLDILKNPKTTLLTRSQIPGFYQYEKDCQRISKISKTFSFIIIIVTTMLSLMVIDNLINQDKKQIGFLKSIGCNMISIEAKYVIYSLLVSLLGGLIGSLLTSKIFLKIILIIIKNSYNLSLVSTSINPNYALLCMLFTSLVLVLYTIISFISVYEKPTITLINDTYLNKNKSIKLSSKLRFLINKKSLLILLIITGCFVAITASLNVLYSVKKTNNIQYKKIEKYDLMVDTFKSVDDKDLKKLSNKKISNLKVSKIDSDIQNDNNKIDINIMIPSNYKSLNKFIKVKNINKKKVTNNGIIITKKLAYLLNVKKDDYIKIDYYGKKKIKVTSITNDYVNNYVYMLPTLHNKLSKNKISYNTILLNITDKNVLVDKICNDNNVKGCTFKNNKYNNYLNDITPFYNIIKLLLLIHVSLFIIIMILLISLNISNEKDKIINLNKLGYDDFRKALYVNKDTISPILFGIFIGVILGIFLSSFLLKSYFNNTNIFTLRINFLQIIVLPIISLIIFVLITYLKSFSIKDILNGYNTNVIDK